MAPTDRGSLSSWVGAAKTGAATWRAPSTRVFLTAHSFSIRETRRKARMEKMNASIESISAIFCFVILLARYYSLKFVTTRPTSGIALPSLVELRRMTQGAFRRKPGTPHETRFFKKNTPGVEYTAHRLSCLARVVGSYSGLQRRKIFILISL
jgi:hypothetical protein